MSTQISREYIRRLAALQQILRNNFSVLCLSIGAEGILGDPELDQAVVDRLMTKAQRQELAASLPVGVPVTTLRSAAEEKSNIYYTACRIDAAHLIVVGPMSDRELTDAMHRQFCYDRKLGSLALPVPVIRYMSVPGIFQIVVYLMTGELKAVAAFLAETGDVADRLKEDLPSFAAIDYRRQQSEREYHHLSYETEQEYFREIREGRLTRHAGNEQVYDMAKMSGDVGIMSASGMVKQMEYTAVTTVTLATRAAIDGGVAPDRAYQISDVLLQECSRLNTAEDYIALIGRAREQFTREVIRCKAANADEIENVRNYIAAHLFTELRVRDMAGELGFSYSYLSAKFRKKTGQSITEYIVKSRLEVVEYYLRFTDRSIGEIAASLHFSSPSRMAQQFRKAYGETPTAYRMHHQITQ